MSTINSQILTGNKFDAPIRSNLESSRTEPQSMVIIEVKLSAYTMQLSRCLMQWKS